MLWALIGKTAITKLASAQASGSAQDEGIHYGLIVWRVVAQQDQAYDGISV
jgi:hypothetical protein